jgi:hypothetical protein
MFLESTVSGASKGQKALTRRNYLQPTVYAIRLLPRTVRTSSASQPLQAIQFLSG